MKNYNTILFILIICFLSSCNKNDRKQLLQSTSNVTEKIKNISNSAIETITSVKDSITKTIVASGNIKNNKTITEETISSKDSIGIESIETEKLKGFTYFKKLLSTCKTGETLTQKELIENHNMGTAFYDYTFINILYRKNLILISMNMNYTFINFSSIPKNYLFNRPV